MYGVKCLLLSLDVFPIQETGSLVLIIHLLGSRRGSDQDGVPDEKDNMVQRYIKFLIVRSVTVLSFTLDQLDQTQKNFSCLFYVCVLKSTGVLHIYSRQVVLGLTRSYRKICSM